MTRTLSLVETADVLTRLTRQTITPSKVRTMLVLGPGARAMSPKRQGDRRTFTIDDVAMALVLLRLRAEGVSPVVSRVLVANWRDRLVAACHAGDPVAFGVAGMTGVLLWRGARPESVVSWVDLPDVWRAAQRFCPDVHETDRRSSRSARHV